MRVADVQVGTTLIMPGGPSRVTRVESLHHGKYRRLTLGDGSGRACVVTLPGAQVVPTPDDGRLLAGPVVGRVDLPSARKVRVSDSTWRGEKDPEQRWLGGDNATKVPGWDIGHVGGKRSDAKPWKGLRTECRHRDADECKMSGH